MKRRLGLIAALALTAGCGQGDPLAPLPPADPPATIAGEVMVTMAPGRGVDSLAADYGATILEWEDEEWCLVLAPPAGTGVAALVTALLADPRVITAEPNAWMETAESRQQSFAFDDGAGTVGNYAEQAAGRAVRLDEAHAIGTGEGVVVAVLDTGIDPLHPAFAGRLVAGFDFVDGDADPTDRGNGLDDDGDGRADEAFGHGTHVAGIVTLAAPGARIMPIRVLDADGRGDLRAVAAGVRFAVANGARVINLSLGSLESSDAVQDALEEAEGEDTDVGLVGDCVVIASAGNWGAEEPREYPARSSHAYAIAATDTAAQAAPFSSFADYVQLSAPGIGVRSAYPGGLYRLWSGTSMSAPFVAGVAALVRARDPGLDEDDVIERLRATSRPLVGLDARRQGKMGAGMLDAAAALQDPPPGAVAARGTRSP